MHSLQTAVRAAAVAAAASFLVVGTSTGQSVEPTLDASTQPASPSAPAETPSTTAWVPLEGPWSGTDLALYGVATTSDGLATVLGQELFASKATSWSSTDLAAWVASDLSTSGFGAVVPVEAPWGLTAIMTADGNGGGDVWLSDGGGGWTKPSRFKNSSFRGATTAGDQLLLYGNAGKPSKLKPAIWRSRDGATMSRLDAPGLPGKAIVIDAAMVPDGSLLVIANPFGKPAQLYLTGGDGRFAPQPPPAQEGLEVKFVNGTLASVPTGVVMTTSRGDRTLVWFTETGAEWTAVSETSAPTGLLAQDDGYVIVLPSMLVSADGVAWCQLDTPWGEGDNAMGAAFLPDGRLMTVGFAVNATKKGALDFGGAVVDVDWQVEPAVWVTDAPVSCDPAHDVPSA